VTIICQNETRPTGATNTVRPLTRLIDLTDRGLAVKATRTCSVDGCERDTRTGAHHLCQAHYVRQWKHGNVGGPEIGRKRSVCSLDDCARVVKSNGMCELHSRRWRKHGDPRSDGRLSGPAHPSWAGDRVSYFQAHSRVRRLRGSAAVQACACGASAAEWAYDHTDPAERFCPTGAYSTDPARYVPMCRSCHRKFDHNRRTR
jgi:hypothetical protein